MPKLSVNLPDSTRVAHELVDELITIGRAAENLIQIDDPSVSGRHAQLELAGESYYLKDLESTNGTRVNGQTISSVALRAGDRIRFGKIEACFECEVLGDARPLPQLEEVAAKPAESSARPVDFTNASPFPNRKKEHDPTRLPILAAAGIALLAFLGSMIAILLMRAPAL